MRRFLIGCFALIGLATVLAGIAGVLLIRAGIERFERIDPAAGPAKGAIILTVEAGRGIVDEAPEQPLRGVFGGDGLVLRDVIDAIAKGASDPSVKGLFADLSGARIGIAEAQEIRAAVERFRAAGKPAYAFADTLADSASPNQSTYLASAFERVWLQPSGQIGMPGFLLERPFAKDALAEIGVAPRFAQRYEYKGGIDSFTETSLTQPVRAELTRLAGSLYEQMLTATASGRKLDPAILRTRLAAGMLFAEEAREAGLIDAVGYHDEALGALESASGNPETVTIPAYLRQVGRPNHAGTPVALIYGTGAITRGQAENDGFAGAGFEGARIAKAIDDASKDASIRGILLRIDSPGGFVTPSETVWRALHEARGKGKKIVVSMGATAASGGYLIAIAADRIVANPGTITGSIGVFAGKFVLSDLWKKLGISWDGVAVGPSPGAESPNHDFTPTQWARFNEELDRVYADFTGKVARDRKIDPARMDELARGRIWTGAEAVTNGLIDRIGGQDEALDEMRRLLGLASDAPVNLVLFPKPELPFGQALRVLRGLGVAADLGVRVDAGLHASGLADLARQAKFSDALLLAPLPLANR